METVGVRGIWGLEQLEKTGLGATRCGMILIGGMVALNLPIQGLWFGVVPALFLGSIEGLLLWAALVLSRATQADLERFLLSDDGVEASVRMLEPTRKSLLAWFLAFLTFFWVIFAYGVGGISEIGFADFHREWVLSGPGQILFWYVSAPIYALAGGVMIAVVIAQAKALRDAVRRIEVNILQLDRYPHVANPLIRLISFLLITFSTLPIFSLMLNDRGFDRMIVVSTPGMVVFVLTVTALYAYPVWLLKGRIRDAKKRELDSILMALSGDEGAMAESRLGERASAFTISELLGYRTLVESLWDWPIAPHLQKVALFGMLPPLTWVLAGLVENAVGAVVGLN